MSVTRRRGCGPSTPELSTGSQDSDVGCAYTRGMGEVLTAGFGGGMGRSGILKGRSGGPWQSPLPKALQNVTTLQESDAHVGSAHCALWGGTGVLPRG